MLRTLIIDDEPIALEKLRNYVQKTPSLQLVASCGSGFEAIEILNNNEIDLIITDINMPDLNGLDMMKSLSVKPIVIFTTAYSEYAVESYKVSAVDYLLKPYGFVDFSNAVNKAVEAFELRNKTSNSMGATNRPDDIFIKVDYRYVRVALSEIRFIKGYGEYLQIHLEGKANPMVTLSSFAAIKERLSENFIQVHRSFIVNMNHVEQIERNRLVMDADNYIPIGDSYKNAFQQYLNSHSVGKGK